MKIRDVCWDLAPTVAGSRQLVASRRSGASAAAASWRVFCRPSGSARALTAQAELPGKRSLRVTCTVLEEKGSFGEPLSAS